MVVVKHQQNKRQLDGDDEGESSKRVRTDGDQAVEVSLLVASNEMGRVIGKGGETIEGIRAKSGATMHTSKLIQNVGVRTARVGGTIEQVCAAIKLVISTISEEHPSITLLAEHRSLGSLIGKQGVNIRELRESTGAKIYIPKDCIGNSTQKEIQISGDWEAVNEALEKVVCHLAESTNATRIPYVPGNVGGHPLGSLVGAISPRIISGISNSGAQSVCRIETTMWVPKAVIGQIIGRGGANIKTVRLQSTANVNIDNGEDDDDSSERKITIKGSRQAIDTACLMIENLVNQANQRQ